MPNNLRYVAAFTLMAASPLAAQQKDFEWHKTIAAGRTVEISGIIGDISATAASGSEVEVVAKKTSHRGDPESVEIRVEEHDGSVTICALYDDDECPPGRHSGHSNRENDTRVDFEVRVPRGVRLSAHTVVGDVRVTGMTADLDVSSVTGDIRASSTGLVEASSVSGSLNIRMGRADWPGSLDFHTVSGSITLELPSELNADIHVTTVSGELSSDWPVTIEGRSSQRRIRGRIGTGGRELSLSTVSGDIELRKAQ